ncbi:MAG: coniferyl-alcohol dehydrogenase [Pseudomonadota bacterium]
MGLFGENQKGPLEGKTIIVTGCASGIGAETTALLKAKGARVIGVDRNPADHADEFHKADLSDPTSIDELVSNLPSGANGLANIAGLPPTAPPELVIRVNLLGLQMLTEGLVPKLADGASIANLASLAGFGWAQSLDQIKSASDLSFETVSAFVEEQGITTESGRSYFFSKEALIVWTLKNRWTWRDRQIRMNCVSPGPVETPILKDFIETLGERAEEDMKIMDRPGRPDDVAPVIAFLMSDESAWFRGANLTVDGGMSSHILEQANGL